MRRAWWPVGVIAAVAVAAAGCASVGMSVPGAGGQQGSGSVSFAPTPGDPLLLVGSWQLDAPGEPTGSVLRLGDDLSVWSSCGYLMGAWAADPAGLFAGHVSGGSGACMDTTSAQDLTPQWLTRVVAFRADAAGAQLLDATGVVVATLRPGGYPTAGPDISADLAQPPTVTDGLRSRLRAAAPLPAGLVAARPGQLVGRWMSATTPTPRGFAELAADGSWTGSDGANVQRGRWSAAADGELVVVAGAQTLAGCLPGACADVGGWFVAAARAAFDGPTLVLLDVDAKVTGRLTPAPAPPAPAPVSPGSFPAASPAPVSSPAMLGSAAPSTCSGFALSLVSDRGGQPTPVAAAQWLARHGGIPGIPLDGWQLVSQGDAEASVRSGAMVLHVIEGPDQTWQVDGGQSCP